MHKRAVNDICRRSPKLLARRRIYYPPAVRRDVLRENTSAIRVSQGNSAEVKHERKPAHEGSFSFCLVPRFVRCRSEGDLNVKLHARKIAQVLVHPHTRDRRCACLQGHVEGSFVLALENQEWDHLVADGHKHYRSLAPFCQLYALFGPFDRPVVLADSHGKGRQLDHQVTFACWVIVFYRSRTIRSKVSGCRWRVWLPCICLRWWLPVCHKRQQVSCHIAVEHKEIFPLGCLHFASKEALTCFIPIWKPILGTSSQPFCNA